MKETSQVTMLQTYLAKPVRKQLKTLPLAERNTLQKNVDYLRQRYGGEDLYLKARRDFKNRDRKPKEKIGDYADTLRSLYARGYPETPLEAAEQQLYSRIWEGQDYATQKELRLLYADSRDGKPRTSQGIVQLIKGLDNSLTNNIELRPADRFTKRPDTTTIPSEKVTSPDDSPDAAAATPAPRPRADPSTSPCFNCNQLGHWSRDCTKEKNIRRMNINKAAALCSICDDPDHFECECSVLYMTAQDQPSNC